MAVPSTHGVWERSQGARYRRWPSHTAPSTPRDDIRHAPPRLMETRAAGHEGCFTWSAEAAGVFSGGLSGLRGIALGRAGQESVAGAGRGDVPGSPMSLSPRRGAGVTGERSTSEGFPANFPLMPAPSSPTAKRRAARRPDSQPGGRGPLSAARGAVGSSAWRTSAGGRCSASAAHGVFFAVMGPSTPPDRRAVRTPRPGRSRRSGCCGCHWASSRPAGWRARCAPPSAARRDRRSRRRCRGPG